jgi:transcription factor C subunit 7
MHNHHNNNTDSLIKNIYLIRHCNRLDSDMKDSWKEITFSQHEVPLSTQGVKQAFRLAESFRNKSVDLIFSSPFLRCVQTSFPLSIMKNIDIKVDNRLCEWFSPKWFREKPVTLSHKELFNYNPTVDLKYHPGDYPFYPEYEADVELRARVSDFWKSINLAGHNNVAIISHGMPIKQLLKVFDLPIIEPEKGMVIHVSMNSEKFNIEGVQDINAIEI